MCASSYRQRKEGDLGRRNHHRQVGILRKDLVVRGEGAGAGELYAASHRMLLPHHPAILGGVCEYYQFKP